MISVSCNLYAQKKGLFIRVFDSTGKRIDKGYITAITDSTVMLNSYKGHDTIAVRDIASIRTKHNPAHNIMIGIGIGGATGLILGIAGTSSSKSSNTEFEPVSDEGVVLGSFVLGMSAGALVGGLSNSLKNYEYFVIKGDPAKWKVFQARVMEWNAKHHKQ